MIRKQHWLLAAGVLIGVLGVALVGATIGNATADTTHAMFEDGSAPHTDDGHAHDSTYADGHDGTYADGTHPHAHAHDGTDAHGNGPFEHRADADWQFNHTHTDGTFEYRDRQPHHHGNEYHPRDTGEYHPRDVTDRYHPRDVADEYHPRDTDEYHPRDSVDRHRRGGPCH